jgi:hypothetical protein
MSDQCPLYSRKRTLLSALRCLLCAKSGLLHRGKLHDSKVKPLVETFNAGMLEVYGMVCGWVLARAHSKASRISSTISGYLGPTNDDCDIAMGKFALAYADQAARDHAELKAAVRKGKIAVCQES